MGTKGWRKQVRPDHLILSDLLSTYNLSGYQYKVEGINPSKATEGVWRRIKIRSASIGMIPFDMVGSLEKIMQTRNFYFKYIEPCKDWVSLIYYNNTKGD